MAMNGKRGCDMLVADTKKPPVGGFIESRKMFSGISPEGKNCSQAIFTSADLLKTANTSMRFQRQYTSHDLLCNPTFEKTLSEKLCCRKNQKHQNDTFFGKLSWHGRKTMKPPMWLWHP